MSYGAGMHCHDPIPPPLLPGVREALLRCPETLVTPLRRGQIVTPLEGGLGLLQQGVLAAHFAECPRNPLLALGAGGFLNPDAAFGLTGDDETVPTLVWRGVTDGRLAWVPGTVLGRWMRDHPEAAVALKNALWRYQRQQLAPLWLRVRVQQLPHAADRAGQVLLAWTPREAFDGGARVVLPMRHLGFLAGCSAPTLRRLAARWAARGVAWRQGKIWTLSARFLLDSECWRGPRTEPD